MKKFIFMLGPIILVSSIEKSHSALSSAQICTFVVGPLINILCMSLIGLVIGWGRGRITKKNLRPLLKKGVIWGGLFSIIHQLASLILVPLTLYLGVHGGHLPSADTFKLFLAPSLPGIFFVLTFCF